MGGTPVKFRCTGRDFFRQRRHCHPEADIVVNGRRRGGRTADVVRECRAAFVSAERAMR
jgi:hypothetical protein